MADDDPYLALAREIREEVARVAADPHAHIGLIAEAFERIGRDERARVAQRVFDALDPQQQWEVIERAFGDDEVRAYLADERAARRVAASALHAMALDTRAVAEGSVVTLGLFRDHDVRAAVARGHRSHAAARRLVLRSRGGGEFQVLSDVFNPDRGYFVTGEYTEDVWRHQERLASHTTVSVGSMVGDQFEPILYPGGRVDVRKAGDVIIGQLHLGFAMLGAIDLFVP